MAYDLGPAHGGYPLTEHHPLCEGDCMHSDCMGCCGCSLAEEEMEDAYAENAQRDEEASATRCLIEATNETVGYVSCLLVNGHDGPHEFGS